MKYAYINQDGAVSFSEGHRYPAATREKVMDDAQFVMPVGVIIMCAGDESLMKRKDGQIVFPHEMEVTGKPLTVGSAWKGGRSDVNLDSHQANHGYEITHASSCHVRHKFLVMGAVLNRHDY